MSDVMIAASRAHRQAETPDTLGRLRLQGPLTAGTPQQVR